ncbi:1-(5-phosphoribosyl)-5-[(5-phosphoribosylamino) methylideneamino] imidazole-4-carboxamide isomerase [Pseudomonas straminea]|uniref:Uncharacterized conserved protein, DUF2164 family n=1 Tax=Pseudomonas straminea TaxID=47882 RepID=A0A1I1RFU2_PSEOC|nr:DUF2164 domain-containing protein [Pseudomonas straminea]GLX12415.1 1-(5-phosphoribosyl)-5-[(5-phosphoribosylamino) methylideneamino] imidazole-4-carboxamide isomerase [Pseudomonas straminea]SFD33185.1 Uncharacterized conserved protein, DUF2164 family [Pseudomonas straminea]
MARLKGPVLTLTPEQESDAVHKLQRFLSDRFELELLELFGRDIAPHYYNRAITDAHSLLRERFESLEVDLWALEKD